MAESIKARRIISHGNNDSSQFLLDLDSNSSNSVPNEILVNKSVSDSVSGDRFFTAAACYPISNRIKAYYQNVGGLRTKTSGFLH